MALINWQNLPCGSLDGVTSNEFGFLSELSTKNHKADEELMRFINFISEDGLTNGEVLDSELPVLPSEAAALVPNLPDQLETEDLTKKMDEAEIESLPTSSREQMVKYGKKFINFLSEHSEESVETMAEDKLAEYLRYFFFCLKKSDGSQYAPATLVCIRAGIQRYINILLKRRVNIISSTIFASANRMLRVKVRDFHDSGGTVRQYEAIEDGDLKKIREYFDRSTAEKIQDEVIFTILYVLGERGQEHLHFIRKRGALVDMADGDGIPYLKLPALPTKNLSTDPTKSKGNLPKQSRIYGLQRELLQLYESFLPASMSNYFPRPLANSSNGAIRFSTKQVRGINWLKAFMAHLTQTCKLSKPYSNHCIRVTRIADMFDDGFTLDNIMAVTGQRSESTVCRYLSRKRDKTLRAVSMTVSDSLKRRMSCETEPAENAEMEWTEQVGEIREAAAVSNFNQTIDVKAAKHPMFSNCLFDGCTFNF